jgi:pimeloyl-ACP methyl ester carboxylesterase
MADLIAPRLEGTVTVAAGRRMGYAEFGDPRGRPFVWLHGTPGARRQIPHEARAFAVREGIRLVGIDRPGIGSSTPHVYPSVRDFAADLAAVGDALGMAQFGVVGLSGGGPYALAAGAVLVGRVPTVGVLGGVAPTQGPDAAEGGLVSITRHFVPLISAGRVPLGIALTNAVRVIKPLASPVIGLYGRLSPPGDRRLLAQPEFKAMFIDDLLNGSRRQLSAPLADLLAFTRHWGFEAADVRVPVVWWHGDDDRIVPYRHGEHMVARLPDAELRTLHGESHLGGLGVAAEILTTLVDRWDHAAPAATAPASA